MTLIAYTADQLDACFHALTSTVSHVLAAPKIPKVDEGATPPFSKKLEELLGWLEWLVLFACVAGFMVTGGRMALAWRSGGEANLAQLGWVMVGCVLVGGATGIVKQLV
jgi:hypothetical protein